MTRQEIAARNRMNAQKSTGPRTAHGKAVVAGNARRHGATAQPDPERVATWLGIILDEPEITPEALLSTDERSARALLLAEAEAKLVSAENALRRFEADMPRILKAGEQFSWKDILEGLASGASPRRDRRLTQSQVRRLIQTQKEESRSAERQHRLLTRYVGEARSKRRKALMAWLEVRGVEKVAA